MKNGSVISDKSLDFALRIIKAYKFLINEKQEYVLSKQILRSGTAIGALIREGEFAESKKDFIHKLSIALKEANETEYWLVLLKESDYISEESFCSIHTDCVELIKLLVSIIKSSKNSES
ncbi:four helix bundle protein [Oscillospiraceae bacterium N12]|jgi:four helix bundle protein|uniref:Four helix bundle protein n=1 Tax=Jilunia laotingensis TaxID=2763675 RepID=A0A926IQG4_9BACT|nr:four helix bundle protein [Jilunia laotingensis]MBC8594284.1 four helix bundle protein [Jilunia laotingensis]